MKTIKVNGEVYEEIPRVANAASKVIADFYVMLGRPTEPFTESGKKMMNLIISVWEDLYPRDAHEWYAERKEYQNNELSLTEQVHKQTGRSLASYPYPIYRMMKKIFKGFDPTERNNCIKMVREWPMFRFANKV